jgi:hypothetical protein
MYPNNMYPLQRLERSCPSLKRTDQFFTYKDVNLLSLLANISSKKGIILISLDEPHAKRRVVLDPSTPRRHIGEVQEQLQSFLTSTVERCVCVCVCGQLHTLANLLQETTAVSTEWLGGPQRQSRTVLEEKKIFSLPGFESRTAKHADSRYTDAAITAPTVLRAFLKCNVSSMSLQSCKM